jgi:hypothetical protein
MIREYKDLIVREVNKFRVLILIGIATAFTIGIIVHFYPLKDKIDSVISLAVGGIVTGFLSYYQSKDEIKKTELLKKINNIAEVQERIHLSLIRGPLVRISIEIGQLRKKLKDGLELATVDNIEKLQRFHSANEDCFKSSCHKIRSEADFIRAFIGDIYQEIVTTTNYLDNSVRIMDLKHNTKLEIIEECTKAIHEADILRDHIDDLLFLRLDPKDFDRLEISTALKSNCIIVVGSKKERDKPDKLGHWIPVEDDRSLAVLLYEKRQEKYNSS